MMDYEIIGPFDTYRVVVGGRQVPYLDATPMNGPLCQPEVRHPPLQ